MTTKARLRTLRTPSLEVGVERFLESFLRAKRLDAASSRSTLASYHSDLKDWAEFLGRHKLSPESFDPEALIQFCAELSDQRKLKARTIARRLSALRQLYLYLNDEQGITTDPFKGYVPRKTPRTLPKLLSRGDIETLLETAATFQPYRCKQANELKRRDEIMIVILYATGLRISELVGLKLGSIRYRERQIKILGKGSKERLVLIAPEALEALRGYIKLSRPELLAASEHDFVFTNPRGHPLTRQAAWVLVQRLGEAAGLATKLSPHVLRHSFATHLIEAGMNLRSLQTLLGHCDISTTQIYTHVSSEHLKDTHRRFHPRGK